MHSDEITALDACALSAAVHRRELSCREADAGLPGAHRRAQPAVNALVGLLPHDGLLAQADERDAMLARGHSMGWMHGFPMAIKELSPVAGLPLSMGSPLLAAAGRAARLADGRAHEGGRRHRHRQEQRARVRPGLAHLQPGVRHHAQRLGRDAQRRRLQRRRGGVAGAAAAAGGRRQRHDGLAAQPRRLGQRLRPAPEPGPRALQPACRRRLCGAARHRRADGPHACATWPCCCR